MNRHDKCLGWCRDCAVLEPLKDERCYDCWHEWRESQPCWKVYRPSNDWETSGAYLEHEARAFCVEMNTRGIGHFEVRQVSSWYGDRMGHPGYLKNRIRAIEASHDPETVARWKAAMGDSIKVFQTGQTQDTPDREDS